MKHILKIILIVIVTSTYGQSYSDLEKVLTQEFPENSTKDGRWVFYSDQADIVKLDKPSIKLMLPQFDLYKVTLTNYLGYHVNQGTCVALFDSLKSKVILVEPIWYSGIGEPLIKPILKKQFDSKEQLIRYIDELNEVLEIGSIYKFVKTSSTDNLITYDLIYQKGDNYTTGGNGTSSTINYTKKGIWRQIEIRIKDLKIVEYTSINPALKDDKEYKKDYKVTIK